MLGRSGGVERTQTLSRGRLSTRAGKAAGVARGQRLKEEKKLKEAHMNELMGYSNVDNPYGDTNLTDKFKWHKKREMEERKGISEEEARVRDLERRRETVSELEKLKKRRMEREVEKAQHEADLVRGTRTAGRRMARR